MLDRKVWFIRLTDELGRFGIGEIAPIAQLSPECVEDIPKLLKNYQTRLSGLQPPKNLNNIYDFVAELIPRHQSSIRFGLEMALLDLINGGEKKIFTQRLESIRLPINGLIWMGEIEFMQNQIKEKLEQGFNCLKLKVGASDFEKEVKVIKKLRAVSEELIIRLDANGAFASSEVLAKLNRLSKYQIHSIEQPILPMQPEAMQIVCAKSEVPIALDEELIYVFKFEDRRSLLQELKPHYLVLKPTLHGGFSSVSEWINLAEVNNIEWWATSYLESNIGLNAIAQFSSLYENNNKHHGLGTGTLYNNNLISPILIENGMLCYSNSEVWGDIQF